MASELPTRRRKWVVRLTAAVVRSLAVSRLEIREFTDEHVVAAGQLLAERHRRHRLDKPLLSAQYEDAVVAEGEVAAALAADDASGSVALSAGEVVGYLIGSPKNDSWGPNIWVEGAGHAVEEAETLRDLYAHAAARWVDEGRTAHYTLVPSHDAALIDAWFHLCFGLQHLHAIQPPPASPIPESTKVTVRDARRDDIPHLAAMEVVLPEHQCRSPVFSSGGIPTLEESQAEWEDDFDDPTYKVLVAEHEGAFVGSAIGCALTKSSAHKGLLLADNAGFLGFAAVYPEHRGLGAGRALAEAVMNWSAEAGYDSVATDWRATNLLSSRTWPRLGFENTFARLHRVVGH